MSDHFVQMDRYGIAVRADGAVKTPRRGVYFGHETRTGYRRIKTRVGMRLVHRLILEAFVGPSRREVNHRNGVRSDNRLGNLEYCSRSQNIRDHVLRNDSAKGAYLQSSGRWQAKVWDGSKTTVIGVFDTWEEAHNAFLIAREEEWRKRG